MAKIKSEDWRNLPIEDWNTKSYHAYLIDRNWEEYGATYEPFGKGPVGKRWGMEQGQIKRASEKYGNELIKLYIDKCFDKHKFNPKFPTLAFGFMFAYMRNELSQAEAEINTKSKRTEIAERTDSTQIDEDWF